VVLIWSRKPSFSLIISPSPQLLSDDLEMESQKVRSMYEAGANLDWHHGRNSAMETRPNIEEEGILEEESDK
jgi:hypothetical protein